MPYTSITSAGPLEHIYLGNELSCQVYYAGLVPLRLYPPTAIPGDCGTFLEVGGTLYAPDFANHDVSSTGSLGLSTPFTPVSQSPVTGAGTAADPYKVVTVVDVGTTGLRITQTDSYVVGEETYRTDVTISNSGAVDQDAILYRAGDCFLGAPDLRYGFLGPQPGAVGCAVNVNNTPASRIEQWVPLTGPSNYLEDFWDDVWVAIGTGLPFPSTCECTKRRDNAVGLSWTITIPAGGSITHSHETRFSATGITEPPVEPPIQPARVAVVASSTNWTLGEGLPGDALPTFSYGNRPLTPMMGDWDGDGLKTVGTFESGTFRLNNQNDGSAPDITFVFGDPRAFAVAGDYDGNGYDDVALYRKGVWQIHYLGPEAPADGTFTLAAPFGQGSWPHTVPVAGDWDGDGTDGIGTYDLATGTWVLKNTVGPGGPDIGPFVFWGGSGSYPVVGDFGGIGRDTPGYRVGTTWTVRIEAVTGGATKSFDFGVAGSIPLTW